MMDRGSFLAIVVGSMVCIICIILATTIYYS